MTYFDAWIREPTEADLQAAGLAQDSSSTERSPLFPDGRTIFFLVRDAIATGSLRGWQVDPLTYAALMKSADIEALLTKTHGPPGEYEAGNAEHLANRMRELRAYVAHLPKDRWFAVVVDEF